MSHFHNFINPQKKKEPIAKLGFHYALAPLKVDLDVVEFPRLFAAIKFKVNICFCLECFGILSM